MDPGAIVEIGFAQGPLKLNDGSGKTSYLGRIDRGSRTRVLLEKLIMKFHEGALPCSQELPPGPYSDPAESRIFNLENENKYE
jgi:hypothetical protein